MSDVPVPVVAQPPVLVRADRRGVDQVGRQSVGGSLAWGLVITGVLSVPELLDPSGGRPSQVLAWVAVAVCIIGVGRSVRAWLRACTIDVPLEVDDAGITLRTVAGEAFVPWGAITSAVVEKTFLSPRELCLVVLPADDPRAAGVRWAMRGPIGSWYARRYGVRLAVRALQVDLVQLGDHLWTRSSGLVRLGIVSS